MEQSKRKFVEKRKVAMENERSSFIPHYRELSEYMLPRRGRFMLGDRNKGGPKYKSIINSAATQAIKVSRAGLMSGVMNASQPWFALATENADYMQSQAVRVWLDQVSKKLNSVFNKSNLYNMAPVMLGELITFGTGAMSHVDDEQNVARFFAHTVGSYCIAQNERYEVDTFLREYEMTAEQMIGAYGLENVSKTVKNLYDSGKYDEWVPVVNYVGQNSYREQGRLDSKNKPYMSCYFEPHATGEDKDKFLKESGFDEFPVYVPRWDLTGEDVYGSDCPGMITLGDVKQLQIAEKRKAQAIDKLVNPPLKGPSTLRNVPVSSLPGGLTIFDTEGDKAGLTPIYQVDPRIAELKQDLDGVTRRINEAFFVDLFFAITQMEGIQPRTQLELMQRNQERLLQLGPVLERIQSEFLAKLIERTFNQLARRDLLPLPPPELEGQPLKVDFVSSLAMAQRSAQVNSINQLRLFVSECVQSGLPEVIDKFDADQAIDEMSLILGAPAKLVRSDEQVAEIREARRQAAEQQAQEAQAVQATEQLVQISRR